MGLRAILPLLSVKTELGLPIYVAATAWSILTIYRYLEEVQGTKAPRQIQETILAYTTTGHSHNIDGSLVIRNKESRMTLTSSGGEVENTFSLTGHAVQ